MLYRFVRVGALVGAMAFLTSCGAILEEATEQAVERGLEEGGVEIDLDDIADGEFEVTIEDENGEEATLDFNAEEGVVEFESEEGEGSIGFEAGLAEGWPDEYPMPEGLMIVTSSAFEDPDQQTFHAIFTGPLGSLDENFEHFESFDLEVNGQSDSTTSGTRQRTINWGTDTEQTGTLVLGENGDELFGQITLVIKN